MTDHKQAINGHSSELTRQEQVAIEQVREAIRSIEFGSVLIKIHQGEVVGIETAKKLRFGSSAKPNI